MQDQDCGKESNSSCKVIEKGQFALEFVLCLFVFLSFQIIAQRLRLVCGVGRHPLVDLAGEGGATTSPD